MTLSIIPTELDMLILSRLEMEDKARLNCVSQYYRRLTEPLLYENICMYTDEDDRIKRLLMTLLYRKDLRLFVKRFDLYHARNVNSPRPPLLHDRIAYDVSSNSISLCELLWAHTTELQNHLAMISSHYSISADLRMIWYNKILEPYPMFDGALALLLSMMPNIGSIHLELCPDHPLPMTQLLLADFEWARPEEDNSTCCLAQLNNLRVISWGRSGCAFTVAVRPGLQQLWTQRNSRCWFTVPTTPPVANNNTLRTLELYDADIDPQMLENAIVSSWLSNLERFIVVGVGRGNLHKLRIRPWLSFNYLHLQQTMRCHLLRLRVFRWTHMAYMRPWDDRLVPFSRFANFPHLQDLCIDFNLCVPSSTSQPPHTDLLNLTDPFESLPSSLQLVVVEGIPWEYIWKTHRALVTTHLSTPPIFSHSLISVPSLKTIYLTIDMRLWRHNVERKYTQAFLLNEPAVHALRQYADKLQHVGVRLEAGYYLTHPGEDSVKMLLGPGYTAPGVYYDGFTGGREWVRREILRAHVATCGQQSA